MSNEITPDYSQSFLFPPQLEDWVPSTHPVRFVREFINSLDLKGLGFKIRKVEEGRPNYSSYLLLGIWLYGYLEKIYSTRVLEKACCDNLPLMWLTGLNKPDHNTIWRFYRDNHQKIKEVFRQTVKIAYKSGLIGLALQAVDGTKIAADVSKNRALYLEDLKKLIPQLDKVAEEIDKEIRSQEKSEKNKGEWMLPHELSDKRKLERLIRKGIEELGEEECVKLKWATEGAIKELESEGLKQISLTDKESVMVKNGISGIKEYGYNAQCVVDSQEQIITASGVSVEASDNSNLLPMLEESEYNTGSKSQETLADAGYFSGEQLKEIEERGYSVLVSVRETISGECENGQYHKRKFEYDKEKDVYRCPHGQELCFEREKKNKQRADVRVYRCHCWRTCDYASKCSNDKRGRAIERSIYEESVERQLARHKEKENKSMLSRRKEIVEPVFGWVKRNLKFCRWTFRGLRKVEGQWNLICTVLNLKKLYIRWLTGEVVFG